MRLEWRSRESDSGNSVTNSNKRSVPFVGMDYAFVAVMACRIGLHRMFCALSILFLFSCRLDAQEKDSISVLRNDMGALIERAFSYGAIDSAGKASAYRAVEAGGNPVLLRDSLLELLEDYFGSIDEAIESRLDENREAYKASAMHPSVLALPDEPWALYSRTQGPDLWAGLAKDREIMTERLLHELSLPQFVRRMDPSGRRVVMILYSVLGGGKGFFMASGASPYWNNTLMAQLIPLPAVGGTPYWDEWLFLRPEFDPLVYGPYVTRPVPQYNPLDPEKSFVAPGSLEVTPAGKRTDFPL